MEEMLEDYSQEEIRDILQSRTRGNHTYPAIQSYSYTRKRKSENTQEQKVEMYSKFDLPLEITHILVQNGINTYYDLVLKSTEELQSIPGMTPEMLEIIISELESKDIFLKEDSRRQITLENLKGKIEEDVDLLRQEIRNIEFQSKRLEDRKKEIEEFIEKILGTNENAQEEIKVLGKIKSRK